MDHHLFETSQLEEKLQRKLHLPGVVACVGEGTELIRVTRTVGIEAAGIDRLSKLRMIQRVECLRPVARSRFGQDGVFVKVRRVPRCRWQRNGPSQRRYEEEARQFDNPREKKQWRVCSRCRL